MKYSKATKTKYQVLLKSIQTAVEDAGPKDFQYLIEKITLSMQIGFAMLKSKVKPRKLPQANASGKKRSSK